MGLHTPRLSGRRHSEAYGALPQTFQENADPLAGRKIQLAALDERRRLCHVNQADLLVRPGYGIQNLLRVPMVMGVVDDGDHEFYLKH